MNTHKHTQTNLQVEKVVMFFKKGTLTGREAEESTHVNKECSLILEGVPGF